MTETRFTWRWLLVIAVVGLFMGLIGGLAAGWIIFPNISSSNIAGLSPTSQNDYIVLVANTYVYDRDTAHAKQRLAQLHDKDIKTRVERLAKALAARKDPAAASVADLAIELGSEDSSLQVMAAELTNNTEIQSEQPEATKVAQSDSAEPTVKPTKVKKPKATQAPPAAPTDAPEPTNEPKPTDVPQVQEQAPPAAQAQPTAEPTQPPAPAPAPASAEFTPEFPAGSYSTVNFAPANVAAGQKYWRLKTAIFCDRPPPDQPPTTDTCPGYPGGENDHSIYVAALDESGGCVEVVAKAYTNLGETFDMERKDAISGWSSCNVDYERNMNGEGNDIWIDAEGLPSDRLNGLVMNSPRLNWGENKAHVRYFLVFQRATR